MKTWDNVTLDTLESVVKEFWELTPKSGVICFNGDMGVGKTTFINLLCKVAGVNEETSSPTFGIVNEYRGANNQTIYHFDCYRIESDEEAMDFGIEEYFYANALSLVEWPDKVNSLIPHNAQELHLVLNDDETRTITLK